MLVCCLLACYVMVVVWRVLFVARVSLFVDLCVSCIVCCLFVGRRRLMFVVCCLWFVASCFLCFWLIVGCCVLVAVE